MRSLLALLLLVAPGQVSCGGRAAAQESENWFLEHQEPDGRWDADGFLAHDPPDERTGGAGRADWDVGATALATFLMASQQLEMAGVRLGVEWLLAQQDPATGLIGDSGGAAFRLQHALATLALCDALYFESRSESDVDTGVARSGARRAARAVERLQGADGGWSARADVAADAFLTGWMLHALVAARDAGIDVDAAVLAGGLAWLARHTDPVSGRIAFGAEGAPDPFAVAETEMITAQALLLRLLIDRPEKGDALVALQAARLVDALPAAEGRSFRADPAYWLLGGLAAYQLGGRTWKSWSGALKRALLGSGRTRRKVPAWGAPRGAFGPVAGRVGDAALTYLVTELYFRYAAFAGAR